MSNIFFSIICPTYNSEKFIKKSIQSLLNQDHKNFEIIYCDDSSTDKTIDILENYKVQFLKKKINVTILKNTKRSGAGASRNKAIKFSNYTWISFLDSDDDWKPDKLSKVAKIINSKNYNCIMHNEILRKLNGKVLEINYKKNFNFKKDILKQLFLKNFLSTSAITLKKKLVVDANYFNEEYVNAQDYDLWLKIGNNFKIFFINESLGSYNERLGSITSLSYRFRIINLIKIAKKYRYKVGSFYYYYRIFRLFVSREWIKF